LAEPFRLSTDALGTVFTLRSFGFLAGVSPGAFLYDCDRGHPVISASVLLSGYLLPSIDPQTVFRRLLILSAVGLVFLFCAERLTADKIKWIYSSVR